MLPFSSSITANTKRNRSKSFGKRGFTLLETILAVAMLTILVVIIYQGFASTMQYSTNTARLEKSANDANSQIHLFFANAGSSAPTPSAGLYIYSVTPSYTFSVVLPITVIAATPTTALNYGDVTYRESTTLAASNRHGFAFAARFCPTHPGVQLLWYKDKEGNYGLFCPEDNAIITGW